MIRSIQNSFVAGEISPALHARHDLKAYFNGAALIRNFTVRRTGGVCKRPGTDLLPFASADQAAVCAAGSATRVIPFFYDAHTAWLLFVSGDADAADPAPKLAAYAWSCADGDFERSGSALEPIALGEWTGEAGSRTWSGLEVADLPNLSWRQAGDTLFLAAPGHAPSRIVRATDGSWSYLAEPLAAAPDSVVTMTPIVAHGFSGQTGSNYYYSVWEERAGRRVKIKEGTATNLEPTWPEGGYITIQVNFTSSNADSTYWIARKNGATWGLIGEVTTTDNVFNDHNYLAKENLYDQTNIRDADAGGYGLIDFYQQRTVLAGNPDAPFRLWFSRLSDLYNWWADRPLDDECPFGATLPAVRAAKIMHLVSEKRLLLLTEDGAFVVHSDGEGFTYRSCKIERASRTPCGAPRPISTDESVVYVSGDGRRLIEMLYDWARDGFRVFDRSVLAEHLTEASAIQTLAWQESPHGLLWVLLADGTLLSFTYLAEHEVYAWARHLVTPPMGCTGFTLLDIVSTGATDAAAAGVAATSQIYLLARWRPTGAGADVYGVLKMRKQSVADTDPSDCLDCRESYTVGIGATVTYKAAAGAVWKKSTDTAWTTVATAADVTFAGGAAGATYIVGYPVKGKLETLRPEMPDRNIQGMRKNVMDTVLRVRRCGALTIGRPGDTAVAAMPAPAAGALLTGDFKTVPRGACDNDGRIVVESLTPSPAEIESVISKVRLEDLDDDRRGGRE